MGCLHVVFFLFRSPVVVADSVVVGRPCQRPEGWIPAVGWEILVQLHKSGGVRVRFLVRFQAVKALIFGGFPVENPTKKANRLKALLRGISCPSTVRRGFEYG